jgi:hypothetical protein
METPQVIERFRKLREAAWIISGINSDLHRCFFSDTEGTVSFHARSPSGKSVFVLCRENELEDRIQEILDWT